MLKTKTRCAQALLLGLISLLWGCYTVPETGRKSIHLVSESYLEKNASSAFEDLKRKTPISTHKQYNDRIKTIGLRIAEVVSKTTHMPAPSKWEFVVFDEPDTVNAFAMPGGKVGVYTGMFKVAQNDDQLAMVIGHEVAHVVARHGNERVSQQLGLTAIGVGLGIATRNSSSKTRTAVLLGYGAGSTLGILLPFSRKHESEADYIGLLYAARAGYDPREAIPFWENMDQQSKRKAPEFLSTHPSSKTRITDIQKALPQAMQEYQKAIPRTK